MIEFSNVSALWLLTLAIPLILLYLLKRRRRDVVVPSTMLWKQALEDIRADTPFQKLKSSLLLLLQLLILVLITAILSGPHIVSSATLSRQRIMVLDCSASMKATDVEPSRFVLAKQKLLKALDEVPSSDPVLLLAFSSETSIVQQSTNDLSQVRSKLNSLEAADVPGDWSQLIKILEPLLRNSPPPLVMIASDFANVPLNLLGSISFDPIIAGKSGDNIGIIRAISKPLPGSDKVQMLLYQIKNFSKKSATSTLTLFTNDRVMDSFEVTLGPGETLERTTQITVDQSMKVRIEKKPNDVFTLDDDYVLIIDPVPPSSVNLQYDNPFLSKALAVLPSVNISKNGSVPISRIKNIDEAKQPGIYFLTSRPVKNAVVVPVRWNDGHPVLRFVDVGAWQIQNATAMTAPVGAESLVEISSGTIAYASDDNGRKIVLGFSLEDSNLPLLAGFPVFLQNAIQWIEEDKEKPLASVTGDKLRKEGSYQSDGKEGYANFADAGESNIDPAPPKSKSDSSATLVQRKKDVGNWFLILATGIVMVEWWAFHRRVDA
ncbi:MAG TPA: VWA domain-containing protein [Acidobacteriota bacterium]